MATIQTDSSSTTVLITGVMAAHIFVFLTSLASVHCCYYCRCSQMKVVQIRFSVRFERPLFCLAKVCERLHVLFFLFCCANSRWKTCKISWHSLTASLTGDSWKWASSLLKPFRFRFISNRLGTVSKFTFVYCKTIVNLLYYDLLS